MLLNLLFVLAVQWLPISAQVYFNQPTAGEVINGGVPFIVSVTDSYTAPYFSQMTNFSLVLCAGTYSSPVTLYAWNLSNTSPSTVSNSITFPPSIGPSATSAYFLGIKGSILANTSISVTYFSPHFALQNMTGDTSLLPSVPATTPTSSLWVLDGTAIPVTQTASPGRMVTCEYTTADGDVQEVGETGGYAGVSDSGCELEALAYFGVLVTQTRTVTAVNAPLITTPPAFSAFAALLAPFNPSSTTSVSGSQPSATASGPQATSTNTNNSTNGGIASTGTSNSQNAKMVEMLIIAGITLATVIILFSIWIKYGRRRYPHGGCEHHGCGCSGMKKMWDCMSRPILYGKAELDAEKGGLVTVWRKERGSEESGELDGSRERREVESSEGRREVSGRGREVEVDGRERRTFVPGRGAVGDRRSRRTILAELEGDSGAADPMPENMPAPDFEQQMKWPVPVPALEKRAVVVGKCEQGMVVRGKDAAVIVAIGKRARSDSAATATIQRSGDLPHIPPSATHDCCEDFLRTKRMEQQEDAMRICEMRKEIYVMRKEESSKQELRREKEGESCASPLDTFVSISS